jgi:hypothetical protein
MLMTWLNPLPWSPVRTAPAIWLAARQSTTSARRLLRLGAA